MTRWLCIFGMVPPLWPRDHESVDPAIVVSTSLWMTCSCKTCDVWHVSRKCLTPTAAHLCSATDHNPDILLHSNQSAPLLLLLLLLLLFRARHVRRL